LTATPRWIADADRALGGAAARVRVLAASTPSNLAAELARLEGAWARGVEEAPRFTYAPLEDVGALPSELLRAGEALEARGELGAVYAARARELASEAALAASVGTRRARRIARERFGPRDAFDAEADRLAAAWLGEPPERAADHELVATDDRADARSLVSVMLREIGARRLALRVVVVREMAPLAAVGDGVVQIAAGRRATPRDAERTALHELDGHAAPALRARSARLGLFAFGTARGSDDQEGRALAIERARGFLDAPRRRELALRHAAARAAHRGEAFVDTARLLLAEAAPLADALRIAARAHRGGGLGREAVYVPALLRVEAATAADPSLDDVLAAGRVSVDVAPVLRPWAAPA
jgi:hypothetical protein